MSVSEFHLVTHWRFDAPLQAVWREIETPEQWPSWWKAVKRVEVLKAGDGEGVGAVRRFTWTTALPYELSFAMQVIRIERHRLIEGRASGELDGTGIWTFTEDGTGTRVRYDWIVALSKPWMRTLAPLLRPVFAWNHGIVMAWGQEGLRRRLASPVPSEAGGAV